MQMSGTNCWQYTGNTDDVTSEIQFQHQQYGTFCNLKLTTAASVSLSVEVNKVGRTIWIENRAKNVEKTFDETREWLIENFIEKVELL